MDKNAEIYLAGGCFWGTEFFFQQIKGVINTTVGYANGNCTNPTYEAVCTGSTDFVETVKVKYNPQIISLNLLLEHFFTTIDPTTVNQQGADIGSQYRTGIYFTNEEDLPTINIEIQKLEACYINPIVVEVMPLKNFYPAETYHQNYLNKNPSGYCHIPKQLFMLAKKPNI